MQFRSLTQQEESTGAKGVCEIFQQMPCVQAGGEEKCCLKGSSSSGGRLFVFVLF